MRALTAIAFVLLLLLTMSGRSFVFRLRLAEVRASMRQQLEQGAFSDKVTTLSFDAAAERELQWLDGGREFDYAGERYDVLHQERRDGRLLLRCVADKQERALVNEEFKGAPGAARGPSAQLLKLLQQPFLPLSPDLPQLAGTDITTIYPQLSLVPVGQHRSVPTPPPQAAVALIA